MKTLVLLLLFGFISPNIGSAQSETVASQSAKLPSQLAQAQRLDEKGKLFQARKIYEEIFKDASLLDPKMRDARDQYEALNRKILFSRMKEKGSVIVEVKAGDSLYRIAGQYKTAVGLIKKINGLKSDTIYPGMKLKILKVPFTILVDKSDNTLYLFLNDRPIKTYRVATGTNNGTPAGKFTIINKLENPTWYHAGAIVPPDSPKNILGTRWLGFDYQGYGIHGTTIPESIGKQQTAGCVRMLNDQVEELYDLVAVGTVVTVVD